ncbi:MAG: hypothetical protein P1U40_07205 [Coxiellaceae bacterium]|nr:hypothetical protein [Coxiellaceae bacterium]
MFGYSKWQYVEDDWLPDIELTLKKMGVLDNDFNALSREDQNFLVSNRSVFDEVKALISWQQILASPHRSILTNRNGANAFGVCSLLEVVSISWQDLCEKVPSKSMPRLLAHSYSVAKFIQFGYYLEEYLSLSDEIKDNCFSHGNIAWCFYEIPFYDFIELDPMLQRAIAGRETSKVPTYEAGPDDFFSILRFQLGIPVTALMAMDPIIASAIVSQIEVIRKIIGPINAYNRIQFLRLPPELQKAFVMNIRDFQAAFYNSGKFTLAKMLSPAMLSKDYSTILQIMRSSVHILTLLRESCVSLQQFIDFDPRLRNRLLAFQCVGNRAAAYITKPEAIMLTWRCPEGYLDELPSAVYEGLSSHAKAVSFLINKAGIPLNELVKLDEPRQQLFYKYYYVAERMIKGEPEDHYEPKRPVPFAELIALDLPILERVLSNSHSSDAKELTAISATTSEESWGYCSVM